MGRRDLDGHTGHTGQGGHDTRSGRRTRWMLALGVVVVLLGGVVALGWFGQRQLVFHPDTTDPGSIAELGGGEDVVLHTDDGLDLDAWWLPPTGTANGSTVLFLPGNAGNRLDRLGLGRTFADRGFAVLMVEYRGFGTNPGSPSEEGLVRDARAALAWLDERGVARGDTYYVGESMGTGVATTIAVDDPPAGLVLRSPYTSLPDVGRHLYGVPVGPFMRDEFDTLSRIGDVRAPVTVLLGEEDTLIPPDLSRQVAAAADDLFELVAVPGEGHGGPVWQGEVVADAVVRMAAGRG